MADAKPKVEETDEAWQFFYDGFSQLVPKDVVKTKKEALELAEKSYKVWLKQQTPPAEK